MLKKLLNIDPNQRPSAEEILEHHWITGSEAFSLNISQTLSCNSMSEENSHQKKSIINLDFFTLSKKTTKIENQQQPENKPQEEMKKEETINSFEPKKKGGFSTVLKQRLAKKNEESKNKVHSMPSNESLEENKSDRSVKFGKSPKNYINELLNREINKVSSNPLMTSSVNLTKPPKKRTALYKNVERKKSRFSTYAPMRKNTTEDENGDIFLKLGNQQTILTVNSIFEEKKMEEVEEIVDVPLDTPLL